MKHTKDIYSTIILSTLVGISLLLNAPEVLAAKKAVFPNPRALQPVPRDVYPNISGNVNGTTSNTPSLEDEQVPMDESDTTQEQIPEELPSKSGPSFSIVWFLSFAIISIAIVIWYRKMKKSK